MTGFNFPGHADGVRLHNELLDLIAAGALRPIVGREVAFEDLPAALEALEHRETVGRVVARLS
jgi:NADPH:quinone reductase